ncbi:MAG: hypothetical protein K2R93_06150 [Gemmatimonadaceae bacterium]|nr:hypothetical protein [Gemmatimonadaceae bacterium]
MSDRNWEAELAKIDKQLASISDEQLMATSAPVPAKGGAPKALPTGKGAAAMPMPSVSGASGKPWVSWLKVLIAVAAAAGLMFWPWPGKCGAPLIGFTAATGGVALLGVWSAIGTWRHRLGWAHLASLLVTVWGVVLGAREVLPRVGYAVPTADRGAGWTCPAGSTEGGVTAPTPAGGAPGAPAGSPSPKFPG